MPPKRKVAEEPQKAPAAAAAADPLEGLVFAVSGTLSTTQAAFSKTIKEAGGEFASSVTKKVTHLVTTQDEFDSTTAKVAKAKENGIHIVKEAFVSESIAQGKKLDEANYGFAVADGASEPKKAEAAAAAAEESDEEAEKPSASSKKRKGKNDAAEEEEAASSTRSKRTRKAAAPKPSEDESSDEEEAPAKPAKGKKGKAAPPPPPPADSESSSSSSDDDSANARKVTIKVKGRAAVDQFCPNAASCHVLEESSNIYDAMLNQTNIGQNNNKFYVIQVLESDSGGSYYCWNRWGRVGERGQNKMMPFQGNKAGAIQAFKKKFTEKTKNQWDNRANFHPFSGKYTLIEIDYSAGGDDGEDSKGKGKQKEKKAKRSGNAPVSRLDERVQEFIRLIFDIQMMERTLIEMEFDINKMPLGKLTKRQIKQGYEVLKEIEDVLTNNAGNRSRINELSSRFYTLIPHSFGRQVPPPIKDLEMLKTKMKMIDALADIEIATKLIEQSEGQEQISVIDSNYEKLKCDLVPLDEGSEEFQMVAKYVKNTHQNTTPKIKNVFKMEREGELARFDEGKGVGNRVLLWHGSRLTNFVGIISQGLRIAPPEAPKSGYRFGKGIYFADMMSLSSKYCRTGGSNDFVMLLGDVALGRMAELYHDQYMDKPLPNTDSTWALGTVEPDPSDFTIHPEGFKVPYGRIVPSKYKQTSCLEHQYVVYDTKQCHLRYVLHLNWS